MEYDFFHKTTAFTHTMYFFKIRQNGFRQIGKTPSRSNSNKKQHDINNTNDMFSPTWNKSMGFPTTEKKYCHTATSDLRAQ